MSNHLEQSDPVMENKVANSEQHNALLESANGSPHRSLPEMKLAALGVDGAGDYAADADIAYGKCLDKKVPGNNSEKAATICVQQAAKDWNEELNYRNMQLESFGDDDQKFNKLVENAQKSYKAFEKSEFKFVDSLYSDDQLNKEAGKMAIRRERADVLKRHILQDEEQVGSPREEYELYKRQPPEDGQKTAGSPGSVGDTLPALELASLGVDGAGDYPADAEINYGKCLKKAEGKADEPYAEAVVKCTGQAEKDWNDELNARYQQLKGDLTPQQKQALKQSELAWIKYRDAEFKNIDNVYGTKENSSVYARQEAEKARMLIIKERADDLKRHILHDEIL
jgi:uncharacterized protein YecT (DUF1311 family)